MTPRSVVSVSLLGALLLGSAPPSPEPPPATGADAHRQLVRFAELGIHRTGTPVDHRTGTWIARELASYGYDTEVQPFDFPAFAPRRASLVVGGTSFPVHPMYYSGVTGLSGVEAELVDVGLGTPLDVARHDVRGKVVLVHVPMPAPGLVPTLGPTRDAALAAGAAGMVVAVDTPQNQLFGVNAAATERPCGLPVLIVGGDDGVRLSRRDGQLAQLILHADVTPGRSQNVVATLPGTGEGVVVVGTPTNGWFTAATERGGGVGILLTLARHFAARPPAATLVFVATGGHEVGFLGLEHFQDDNPEVVERATTYVHLGASLGAELQAEAGRDVVTTGTAEPTRVMLTSENPVLQAVAASSFAGIGPFAALPPAAGQSGEQQVLYEAGVPILSLSGTFLWFHTPRDLPDTTSPELLDPLVSAFRTAVETIAGLDAGTVRAANQTAETASPLFASGDGEVVEEC